MAYERLASREVMLMTHTLHELTEECPEEIETNAALGRIEAGTFGICVDCGEAISTERLDILPTAVKCRKCM